MTAAIMSLSLARNGLRCVPRAFMSPSFAPQLRSLVLSGNPLGQAGQARPLPQGYGPHGLPWALLAALPQLHTLDVSACALGGELPLAWLLGDGGVHAQLQVLRASGNGLTSAAEDLLWCGALPALRELYLDGNGIAVFSVPRPGSGARLPVLRVLDLSNNALAGVDPRLGSELLAPALAALSLQGNPMRSVRAAVLSAGPVAVLKFLRDKIPLEEIELDQQAAQQRQQY
jgi:Leucine-rich repeat (LRR) protein